jgi:hypothetical protein
MIPEVLTKIWNVSAALSRTISRIASDLRSDRAQAGSCRKIRHLVDIASKIVTLPQKHTFFLAKKWAANHVIFADTANSKNVNNSLEAPRGVARFLRFP